MEDEREPESTIEVDDQKVSETEKSDIENQGAASEADPGGGDVIIIK